MSKFHRALEHRRRDLSFQHRQPERTSDVLTFSQPIQRHDRLGLARLEWRRLGVCRGPARRPNRLGRERSACEKEIQRSGRTRGMLSLSAFPTPAKGREATPRLRMTARRGVFASEGGYLKTRINLGLPSGRGMALE